MISKLISIFSEIYYLFKFRNLVYTSKDNKLDILLMLLDDIGVKDIELTSYWCRIVFNDGTICVFWILGWYNFMSSGNILINNEMYVWDYGRPSYKILYKYKKLVIKTKKDNEYKKIPNQILRKMKLEKLI
jgi:hypothetical protein